MRKLELDAETGKVEGKAQKVWSALLLRDRTDYELVKAAVLRATNMFSFSFSSLANRVFPGWNVALMQHTNSSGNHEVHFSLAARLNHSWLMEGL